MEYAQELEERIASAAGEFAQSLYSRRELAADMSSLVEATSSLSLANLDYWERFIRWELSKAVNSSARPRWRPWVKPLPFPTWIDVFSGDGFKRESALRSLLRPAPNGFFFTLALRRLNDWVPEVRAAAQKTLFSIANESNPEYVVDALAATLPYWNSWQRWGDEEKQVLMGIIAIQGISEALKRRIVSSASGPMTSILAQVGRTAVLDPYLAEIAEEAVQPSVRAKAYRSLFDGKIVWMEGRKWEWTDLRYCKGRLMPIVAERHLSVTRPLLKMLKRAAGDPSSVVRRVAGEILIRELAAVGDEAVVLANLLASDSSPPVAERGRFALKRLDTQEEQ